MSDSQYEILISIIIPVKNGAPWIDQSIPAIMGQTLFSQSEIIILDSGSTDGTLELLKKYPVKLFHIDPETYNHGGTRNFGVGVSRGKYVVMTVQDAIPAASDWLQQLLNGFTDDKIAGVCGQQIVSHDKDKNPVQWFRPVNSASIKKESFASHAEFDALAPQQKVMLCGWDDVTACYRRDILTDIPFRKVTFAEDALWAKDALRNGYVIVYNTAARVFHYHNEDINFTFRRNLTINFFRYRFFNFLPEGPTMTFKKKLQIIKILLKEKIPFVQKIKWWKYNVALFKGKQRAFDVFTNALSAGEKELDAVHEKYCGKAPMPAQKVIV